MPKKTAHETVWNSSVNILSDRLNYMYVEEYVEMVLKNRKNKKNRYQNRFLGMKASK